MLGGSWARVDAVIDLQASDLLMSERMSGRLIEDLDSRLSVRFERNFAYVDRFLQWKARATIRGCASSKCALCWKRKPDADASATGYIGTRYPAMRLGGTASHNCRIMHSCPKIKQNHTCIICRQSSRPTAASTSSPAPELAPRAAARGATVSPYRHGQAWGLKANPVCRSLFWSEGEVGR